MKDENRKEKNDANRPDKRAWQTPELMEADYVLTEAAGAAGGDLAAFASR
jgi:hypothetical protein